MTKTAEAPAKPAASYGVSFKFQFPAGAYQRLLDAIPEGMAQKKAFALFLAPPELEDWGAYLRRSISSGQRVYAALQSRRGEELREVSTHLPAQYKEALERAAESMGLTNLGVAGRMVILSRYNDFEKFFSERNPKEGEE